MRMIRAQLAIDLARKIIISNCSRQNVRNDPRYHVDKNLVLSLMVILNHARARIMQRVGVSIRGWVDGITLGWGTPQAVIDKMIQDRWCPRAIEQLKYQLKHIATALPSVYALHAQDHFRGHENCTALACNAGAGHRGLSGSYAPKHYSGCRHSVETESCGTASETKTGTTQPHGRQTDKEVFNRRLQEPDSESLLTCDPPCNVLLGGNMERVVELIEKGRMPLLKFKHQSSQDDIVLNVTDTIRNPKYAIVSHVWSDGYGNPKVNQMYRCQLEFIRRLLREAQADEERKFDGQKRALTETLPFWMDTLIVPVQSSLRYKNARKTAINQMYDAYDNSRYTIVIDSNLTQFVWNQRDYTKLAMRILAGGWMRRIWTLQEAYLSRKLLFACRTSAEGQSDMKNTKLALVNVDELESLYDDVEVGLVSNLPLVTRRYYDVLLGAKRRARHDERDVLENMGLLMDAWKAVEWRVSIPMRKLLQLTFLGVPNIESIPL